MGPRVTLRYEGVELAAATVRVHLLVAVLSSSRRLSFLHEPQDQWREGLAAAFQHFGAGRGSGGTRQAAT